MFKSPKVGGADNELILKNIQDSRHGPSCNLPDHTSPPHFGKKPSSCTPTSSCYSTNNVGWKPGPQTIHVRRGRPSTVRYLGCRTRSVPIYRRPTGPDKHERTVLGPQYGFPRNRRVDRTRVSSLPVVLRPVAPGAVTTKMMAS